MSFLAVLHLTATCHLSSRGSSASDRTKPDMAVIFWFLMTTTWPSGVATRGPPMFTAGELIDSRILAKHLISRINLYGASMEQCTAPGRFKMVMWYQDLVGYGNDITGQPVEVWNSGHAAKYEEFLSRLLPHSTGRHHGRDKGPG